MDILMEIDLDMLGAGLVTFLVTGFAATMVHTGYCLWTGKW